MRVYLDSPYDWNPLVTRYPMKHHVCVSFLLFFSPAMLTRGLTRPWWRRYNTNIVTSPGTLYITLTERTRTRCAPHSALCVTGLQSTLIHAAGRENFSQPKFAVPKTKPVCLFFFLYCRMSCLYCFHCWTRCGAFQGENTNLADLRG